MQKTKACGAALAAALALAGLAGAARAAETLRVADYLPVNHYLTQEGTLPFLDEVKAATGGEVAFQHFPAQQLGKSSDFLRLTAGNVAQISVVGVSFVADKMELSNVAQMPGAFDKACDGLAAYNAILDTTDLRKRDFTQHGVRLLMPYILPSFEMVTAKTPIRKVEDIKGLKIMVATRATEIMMGKLGAAPMQTTSGAAAYEQIARGNIDGLIFAADSIVTYTLDTVTKYGTRNGRFGGQVVAVIMNQATYDKLPAKAQKAIDEAAKKAADRVCHYVDAKNAEAIQKILARGNELTEFDAAEQAKLQKVSAEVANDWAKELDARKVPASAVLEAFWAASKK